jgi:D-amino-acid oxidase
VYIIPRPLGGGTFIGGTEEERDMTVKASLPTRVKLLTAAMNSFLELLNGEEDFNVVTDIVGRRPSRIGGMRLEVEALTRHRFLVHASGAGGRGVEMSGGIAEAVSHMVRDKRLGNQWS